MVERAPLEVRIVSILCLVLAAVLFLATLLGIGLATIGLGFSGALLAVLAAIGTLVFGAGGFFIRRRSRAWWLVLTAFFVLGLAGSLFEIARGMPLAVVGTLICAFCLFLLLAPGRSRAYFEGLNERPR